MNVGMPSESIPFQPETVTVVVGVNNTVVWTNNDVNGVVHTVTSNTAGQFDSGDLSQGQTFTCAFTVPGTYGYHCIYHPGMIGRVIVKSA